MTWSSDISQAPREDIPVDIVATVDDLFEDEWLRAFRNDEAKAVVCRAILGERQRDRWEPIETAPTNTAILVHVPHLDYYGNNGAYAAMLVDLGTGKRWMTFGFAIGRDLGPDNMPTMWMPLPAPPKGGEA